MNRFQYYLLDKMYGDRKIDSDYLENLWQRYCFYSEECQFPILLSKDDFSKIFSVTYDVIRLKLNEEESKIVLNGYLSLLSCDAIDGFCVDSSWAIDHLWYTCMGAIPDVDTKKFKDCIPFAQEKLVNCFGIEENLGGKLKRKISTDFFIHC